MIYPKFGIRSVTMNHRNRPRGNIGFISNKYNPSKKSGLTACISSRITTVTHVGFDYQINFKLIQWAIRRFSVYYLYLYMHGLIFETSICYWQDQPDCYPFESTRGKEEERFLSLSLSCLRVSQNNQVFCFFRFCVIATKGLAYRLGETHLLVRGGGGGK